MTKLTKPQRTRLEKLAAYLEGLPADYEYFRMWMWITDGSSKKVRHYARHNGGVDSCGTAACAAGHGPAAGILVPPRFIGDSDFVDWRGYALELFVGGDTKKEIWVFGGTWDGVDGGHYAAAARIRYLLDKGEPPPMGAFAEPRLIPFYAPYRIDAPATAS